MKRRLDISQWRDRTEAPVIVWTYDGVWQLAPVAVDDSHENDLYAEFTRAWYAAGAYYNEEGLEEEARLHDLTLEQAYELYSKGDGSAEAAGLPREYYAEGVNEDGSDAIIYVDEATEFETHRETLEEAVKYLDPEDVAEIYQEIIAAHRLYA